MHRAATAVGCGARRDTKSRAATPATRRAPRAEPQEKRRRLRATVTRASRLATTNAGERAESQGDSCIHPRAVQRKVDRRLAAGSGEAAGRRKASVLNDMLYRTPAPGALRCTERPRLSTARHHATRGAAQPRQPPAERHGPNPQRSEDGCVPPSREPASWPPPMPESVPNARAIRVLICVRYNVDVTGGLRQEGAQRRDTARRPC
jgi:hypothetical protein